MEWFESEERRLFLETAKKFAAWSEKNFDEDKLIGRTAPDRFNWEMVAQAEAAGLLLAPLAPESGGVGLDDLGRFMVLETIARGRAGAAALLALHWAALGALGAGPESGRLAGLAWPSPVMEAKGEEAKAVIAGDRVVVSGEFLCPLHPAITERMVIISSDLLVSAGKALRSLCREVYPGRGLLEVPMGKIALNDFQVTSSAILARERAAEEMIGKLRRELYLGLAAVMAGNAAAANDYAWQYAKERVQTGRLILEHQEVRRMLTNMQTLAEAARATAASASADPSSLDRARRAFTFAGTVGEQVCLDAIQVLGGYGYMEDYGLERRLRDHKTLQCLLGSYVCDWVGEG